MTELFYEQHVGDFTLRFTHDPNVQNVLWHTVTCRKCRSVLAEGQLTQNDSDMFGFLDGLASKHHQCRPQAEVL